MKDQSLAYLKLILGRYAALVKDAVKVTVVLGATPNGFLDGKVATTSPDKSRIGKHKNDRYTGKLELQILN